MPGPANWPVEERLTNPVEKEDVPALDQALVRIGPTYKAKIVTKNEWEKGPV